MYYLNLRGTKLFYHRNGTFGIGATGFGWAEAIAIQQKLKGFGIMTEILSPEEYEEMNNNKKKRFDY